MSESRKLCQGMSDADLRRMLPIWRKQASTAHSRAYEAQREISRRDRERERASGRKSA